MFQKLCINVVRSTINQSMIRTYVTLSKNSDRMLSSSLLSIDTKRKKKRLKCDHFLFKFYYKSIDKWQDFIWRMNWKTFLGGDDVIKRDNSLHTSYFKT